MWKKPLYIIKLEPSGHQRLDSCSQRGRKSKEVLLEREWEEQVGFMSRVSSDASQD